MRQHRHIPGYPQREQRRLCMLRPPHERQFDQHRSRARECRSLPRLQPIRQSGRQQRLVPLIELDRILRRHRSRLRQCGSHPLRVPGGSGSIRCGVATRCVKPLLAVCRRICRDFVKFRAPSLIPGSTCRCVSIIHSAPTSRVTINVRPHGDPRRTGAWNIPSHHSQVPCGRDFRLPSHRSSAFRLQTHRQPGFRQDILQRTS